MAEDKSLQKLEADIQAVIDADTDDLLELAKIAGLNPLNDFAGADLHDADLSRANLTGVDLSRVNLSRANLEGANLEGANLEGANLEGANLEGANFEGANLSRFNLSEAILRIFNWIDKLLMLSSSKLTKQDISNINEIIFESDIDGVRYYLVRARPGSENFIDLSPREQLIVALVAEGLPNKVIAKELGVSRWTVATYLRRIYKKLGVTNRNAMIAQLVQNNLLTEVPHKSIH